TGRARAPSTSPGTPSTPSSTGGPARGRRSGCDGSSCRLSSFSVSGDSEFDGLLEETRQVLSIRRRGPVVEEHDAGAATHGVLTGHVDRGRLQLREEHVVRG